MGTYLMLIGIGLILGVIWNDMSKMQKDIEKIRKKLNL